MGDSSERVLGLLAVAVSCFGSGLTLSEEGVHTVGFEIVCTFDGGDEDTDGSKEVFFLGISGCDFG